MNPRPPILLRTIASVVLFFVYGFVNTLLYPVVTVASGDLAGKQFENNNVDNVTALWGINLFTHIGWPFLLLFALLVAIWWPVGKWLYNQAVIAGRNDGTPIALAFIVGALALTAPQPSRAYYDKTDWPEIYFILPNESAFWIPDIGANKDSQAEFMSEGYLKENKIAAKRFQVPHVQLLKSSWTLDYYVPAGRLIIVDRTPYTREWSADASRGTAAADESFKCQSKDGLDITVGVAISAAVMEQDAPRFLYRFGVKPPVGDRNTDAVKFASLYYGKSLTEVMDSVVKGKIQALICAKFSPKTLDEVNAQAGNLMLESEEEVRTYLAKNFGITLDYLGWGDTFGFDETVQKALNDRFAAEKVQPVLSTIQAQVELEVKRGYASALIGFGKGVAEKGLPANMLVLPADMAGALSGAAATAAGLQQAPQPRPVAPARPATVPQP